MKRPPTLTDAQWTTLRRLAAGCDVRHPAAGGLRTREALYRRGLIGTVERVGVGAWKNAAPETRDPSHERWTVPVTAAGHAILAGRAAEQNPPRRISERRSRRRA